MRCFSLPASRFRFLGQQYLLAKCNTKEATAESGWEALAFRKEEEAREEEEGEGERRGWKNGGLPEGSGYIPDTIALGRLC